MRNLVVATLAALLAAAHLTAQSEPAYGLSITYGDGRTAAQPLRPHGAFWTPIFPRIAGVETSRNGLPLYVLDVSFTADATNAIISVTLVYGQFEDRVPVATVHVAPGHPARIDELAPYGVQPVTFAVVSLEPALVVPVVTGEPSGQLDIQVLPAGPDTPLYHVTIANRAGRDLRSIDYQVFGGDTRIASGRRKAERNEPLVRTGREYTFDYFPNQSGGKPWPYVDLFRVTTVVWDDGTVDGDPTPAGVESGLARRRVRQLLPIVDLLSTQSVDLAAIRAAFAQLDRSDIALEHARNEALTALDELAAANDAAALERWIRGKRLEYRRWLARVQRASQ